MPLTGRLPLMLFGITFMITMGITSIMPALPLLATTFNVPLASAALIVSVFALPGLLVTPLIGIWADRYGRKTMLVPSLLIFAFGGVSCVFATDFTTLLLCRALQGIGAAPLGFLYTTIIADTWDNEPRARMMSYCATVLGLGTAVSPAIGGALAVIDWRLPFLLSLVALPVAWLAFSAPLMKPEYKISLASYFQATKTCLRVPNTQRFLLMNLCTSIMLCGPIITAFPLHADQVFSATALEIGLLMASASITAGLMASQLSRFYKRYKTQTLLSVGQYCYILCFLTLPFMPGLWWIIPCILFYGCGQGLTIPIVSTLLSGQAPSAQRASLLAVNSLSLRVAQAFAPLFFSALATKTSPGIAIASGSLLALGLLFTIHSGPVPSVIGAPVEQ